MNTEDNEKIRSCYIYHFGNQKEKILTDEVYSEQKERRKEFETNRYSTNNCDMIIVWDFPNQNPFELIYGRTYKEIIE